MKWIAFLLVIAMTSCDRDCVSSDACSLEPDPGVCHAAITRYYFDTQEKKCKPFTWGGCGGTVPFETLEECKSGCSCD